MLFSITAPAVNDRGPRYMQAVFAALKESLDRGEVLDLYFAPYQGLPIARMTKHGSSRRMEP